MTKKKTVTKFRIKVIERDRWSAPDEWFEYFNAIGEATARIKEINGENTSPTVPDYYVVADEIVHEVMQELKPTDKIIHTIYTGK